MDKVSDQQKAYEEGSLVILSIGGKTWETQWTPSDFGLSQFPDFMRPGRKLLLPHVVLQKIESRAGHARHVLDGFSFDLGLPNTKAKYRWVHMDKLGLVLALLDECKDAYFAAVDELIARYDNEWTDNEGNKQPSLKELMRREVAEFHQSLKVSLKRPDLPDPWPGMQRYYIPKESIRDLYYFESYRLNMIFPSGMTAIKRYELKQADLAIVNRKEAEGMTQERLRQMEAEHRVRLNRIQAEEQARANQQMDSLVNSVVSQLRGKVVEVFQEITGRIRDGKTIATKNLDSIRAALNHVRQMDFLGSDQDFHARLNQINALIDSGRQFSTDAQAVRELNEALSGTIVFVNESNDRAMEEARQTFFGRRRITI